MACLHMDHGKLEEGAELLQQSLDIYELAFGCDHQLTIDVEQQLLGLLHTMKQQAAEDAEAASDAEVKGASLRGLRG